MRDRYRVLLWILQGEKRGEIANRIFSSLQELEDALVEAINEYCEDKEKVRQLCGYPSESVLSVCDLSDSKYLANSSIES